MANAFNMPLMLDTDFASFRAAASVEDGIRPFKIVLAVGSGAVSVGGQVVIAGADSIALYPPLLVAAGTAAYTEIYTDNGPALTWRDFSVTGLTATKTVLYIWYRS